MGFIIGTDEAGYGPNLGPLVISASVWEVPGAPRKFDLYEALADCVGREIKSHGGRKPLVLADSKGVYRPGGGLALLELGVLACLIAEKSSGPESWRALWQRLAPESEHALSTLPWYAQFDAALPLAADRDETQSAAVRLIECLKSSGVRLRKLASHAIFPEDFNQQVVTHGNKAAVLSTVSVDLVSRQLQSLPSGEVLVVCDKHGGRNNYGPFLQQAFPDVLVQVRQESRQRSRYAWHTPHQQVEMEFRVGAEELMPAALASMASKYLRESAMRAFNHFWVGHLPNLRPTAGYPKDARRFRDEISQLQTKLKVMDDCLWRCR